MPDIVDVLSSASFIEAAALLLPRRTSRGVSDFLHIRSTLRFSPHPFNAPDEIDRTVEIFHDGRERGAFRHVSRI